ncbi:MAG: gamma-glutamyl-gamma-aminobutyrate hydrolase family protein [Microthrixaceae bacterium]
MTEPLPRVGLTARQEPVDRPYPLYRSVCLQTTYSDAVERAGGLPLLLAPRVLSPAEADRILASIDALVITGGSDIHTKRYGQPLHETMSHVDELQDDFEFALLERALLTDLPVLCICRGMQILNVLRGGDLDPHIMGKPGIGEHGIPFGGGGTRHVVEVDAGTRLAAALGTNRPSVECHHHQAVERVGSGLQVVARAADGTVEALEVEDRSAWTAAVQWHPEDTAADDQVNQRLFDGLVAAAAGG